MKQTPREILLGRHGGVQARLDQVRRQVLREHFRTGEPVPSARRIWQELATALRRWLWPTPAAWGGLAAVWAVILGLNLEFSPAEPAQARARSAPPSPQARELLRQQRQLMAELIKPEPPDSPHPPRPRSQTHATEVQT